MSLKITQENNVFNIEGRINTATAKAFQTHMEFLFQVNKEVIINIDNVAEIDTKGLAALKSLYMHALVYNKALYITGQGCKEIYHDFRHHNAA